MSRIFILLDAIVLKILGDKYKNEVALYTLYLFVCYFIYFAFTSSQLYLF